MVNPVFDVVVLGVSVVFAVVVALVFVYRSFYGMRIPVDERDAAAVKPR
jgi:Na+-transporting methylmalonyl-CoA/oxaloacetate decarboxylase gamma subunit